MKKFPIGWVISNSLIW